MLASPIYMCLLGFLVASSASAMSHAEICSYRGQLVESFAFARDAGKTEKQTAAETKKQLSKLGPGASDMRSYIQIVYSRRDVTPAKFRLAAEVSCLQGD